MTSCVHILQFSPTPTYRLEDARSVLAKCNRESVDHRRTQQRTPQSTTTVSAWQRAMSSAQRVGTTVQYQDANAEAEVEAPSGYDTFHLEEGGLKMLVSSNMLAMIAFP